MSASLHAVTIGNAIVDVISQADEAFIVDNNLLKGAMRLIDADEAEALYAKMGPGLEMSGGSAGNTAAGIAALGGKAGYIGKVSDDLLGKVFTHDIRAIGVDFRTPPLPGHPPTARCLIMVTPDAQRTMNTFLGACVELGPADIDEALIRDAQVTYLEGYLWDKDSAKEAFVKAAKVAHDAGRKVSLTLSDSFCVDRHRSSFLDLIDGHVDILFANELELTSLFEVDGFDDGLEQLRGMCEMAAITRSEKGCVVLSGADRYDVPAHPATQVIDTTGAGDLFASGFLYGLTTGRHPADAAKIGAIAAAEVISHYGARPEADLKQAIQEV